MPDLAARLRGVVPPLATPFDSTGAVDAGSLRRLIGVQLSAGTLGADAVVVTAPCGFIADPRTAPPLLPLSDTEVKSIAAVLDDLALAPVAL